MFKYPAIITFFLCFGQAYAHDAADGQIHLSFGPLMYQTQFKNERGQLDAPQQLGGGLLVNGDLSEYSSLEIGAFYLDKVFMREQGANVLAEKIRRVYMTIGYRYWFTQKFSAALASFTSYSMGDPRRIHSTTGGDPGFETSAHDTADHGVDMSLAYEAYEKDDGIGVIDIRYSKSLSSRVGEDGDHLALYLAYKKRTK